MKNFIYFSIPKLNSIRNVVLLKVFFIFYFLFPITLSAQDYSSRGKEFWMGFCKNYGGGGTLTVYISSQKANSGTVSIPLGGFSQNFTVAANSTTPIVLPTAQAMATGPDFIENKGVRIVAQDTVSVFALNYQAATSDASVILPVQTIGEEYFVTAYKDATYYSGPTEVLIVGAYNNTTIQITPSVSTLSGKPAGVPFTITLNPGQVYQLMSNGDLTGTHLKSLPNGNTCGKFAVFGANECTNVGGCQYCDHLYEEMFPVNTWGKNYITVPLKTRSADLFRIVASENGTSFTINNGGAIALNRGQFYQTNLSAASSIKSNKPISVAQYSRGQVCDGANSDPFYIMMSPVEQMLNFTTFNAFTSSIISQYYLNIVTKTNSTSVLRLDGANVSGQFSPVPSDPKYSYARINITQGNHTMVSDSGFFAYVYGYGAYESYGYSAGVNLNNLFAKFLYSTTSKPACPNTPVTFTGIGDTSILSWEWDFGDGSSVTGPNPVHVYSDFGTYDVRLIIQRANSCNKDTLKDKLVMTGPQAFIHGPDTSCYNSLVTLTATGDTNVKSFLWSTGETTSSIKVMPNVTTTYWVQGVGICKGQPDSLTLHVSRAVADFSANSVCDGKSVDFKSLSSTNMSVLNIWKWDFGDSQVSNLVDPSHTYTAAGLYNVKHVVANKNGCRDSVTKPLEIYALPKANFSAQDMCLNKQIDFNDLSTSSVGVISTHLWNFGDGNTSNSSNPGHQYAVSGTYSVSLLVTSGFGCRDSITKQVTAFPIPSATFTSTNVCLNNQSIFNSTSTVGVGSISSQTWNFDDVSSGALNVSGLVSPVHLYDSCGTYQVSLLVVSSNACRDSITKNYTVYCLPVASYTANDVCFENPVLFNDLSVISSGNITGWNWSFGDGNTSFSSNPSRNYTSCGTFNTRLIVTSSAGCKDTAFNTVEVYCKPLASYTVNNMCSNIQPIAFTNSSTVSTGSITAYEWNLGDGNTANTMNVSHTYLNENNYNVSLIVTTDKSCKDTVTKMISIFPTPKAAFSISGECMKNDILFTDNSTISGGSITNWKWNFGDGGNSTLKNPKHVYNAANTYTVSLEISSVNGCKDTAYQTLHVSTLPVPSFTVAPVCLKNASQFVNTSTISAGTIASYKWNFGENGNTSTLANPNYTYSNDGSYTVKLIAISTNLCMDSISKNVQVYALPVADFSASEVCLNVATQFNDSSEIKNPYNLASWQWNFGDGNSSSLRNPNHTYSICGNYNVSLKVNSNVGCIDSLSKNVIVHCLPLANYTVSDVCYGKPSIFNNQSASSDGTIVNYEWDFTDGVQSNLSNPQNTFPFCSIFIPRLIVTTEYGCKDTVYQATRVHCIPTANFSTQSVCLENETPFTDLSFVMGDTIKTYFYSLGDGRSSGLKSPQNLYDTCGTYTASLIVESGFGCRDTVSKPVTVHCLPEPAFTSTEECMNFPLKFTDMSGIKIGQIQSRNWEFGDGSISVVKDPTHLYNLCGEFPVRLILTSNFSCKDTVVNDARVFCLPQTDFAIKDACEGNANEFQDLSVISEGNIVSYLWNFGESGSSNNTSAIANTSHEYENCGTYNVKLLSISEHGCRDSLYKMASVHCNPVADFLFTEVCLNEISMFTNLSNVQSALIAQNIWTFGESISGSEDSSFTFDATHVYDSCGTYNVKLSTYSNYGCSDSVSKNVEVYCLPIADFTMQNVCLGLNSSFKDSSSITSGNVSAWKWDFGDGSGTSTIQNPDYTYAASGLYNVSLVSFSNHQCTDTVSKNYQVYHIPIADFNTQNVCLGLPAQFLDSSSVGGGDSVSVWQWNLGVNSAVSDLQNPQYTYNINGIFPVKLFVESNHQCVDSITKNIEIYPLPDVRFGDSMEGCSPLEVAFRDYSGIQKGSIGQWLWEFGDGYTSDQSQPLHVYTGVPDMPMRYSVKLTLLSDQGCMNDSTMPGLISVYPLPDAQFDLDPEVTTLLTPKISFYDKSDGNGTLISWNWDFGDLITSFETNPKHVYQESGMYRIRLIVMNQYACLDTIYKNVEIRPEFTFYIPNAFTPDNDGVNDFFTGSGIGFDQFTMDIFDRWGNHIFNTKSLEKGWDGKASGGKETAQQDVYVYIVKLTDIFGGVHKYVGHVSLVR